MLLLLAVPPMKVCFDSSGRELTVKNYQEKIVLDSIKMGRQQSALQKKNNYKIQTAKFSEHYVKMYVQYMLSIFIFICKKYFSRRSLNNL